MDTPPDTSNCTAPRLFLLPTGSLGASGILLGETLMLLSSGSVASAGSTCSP